MNPNLKKPEAGTTGVPGDRTDRDWTNGAGTNGAGPDDAWPVESPSKVDSSRACSLSTSRAPSSQQPVLGTPGPFQIISIRPDPVGDCARSAGNEPPGQAPRRRYSCAHYDECLDLAAALDWDNFTCRGCSGEIDESLLWRAHQRNRRDAVVKAICELPTIAQVNGAQANGTQVTDAQVIGTQVNRNGTHGEDASRYDASGDQVVTASARHEGGTLVNIMAHRITNGRSSSE